MPGGVSPFGSDALRCSWRRNRRDILPGFAGHAPGVFVLFPIFLLRLVTGCHFTNEPMRCLAKVWDMSVWKILPIFGQKSGNVHANAGSLIAYNRYSLTL